MLRLMIVDDEQIIREALTEMIDYRSIGYELIASAKNGMEAYDVIRDEYPDVVITDIRMPFLNGLELIERSCQLDSKITFILLSGYGEFEYAKQAMKYGVRHYLLKPTDKQELIETLIAIRKERTLEENQRIQEKSQLLCNLKTPFEQCFLMEALTYPEDFSSIYRKYLPLLPGLSQCTTACICSFVEEPYMKNFAADAGKILDSVGCHIRFSGIYVKNTMVLTLSTPTLASQDRIRALIVDLHYAKQSVDFEVSFIHEKSGEPLFYKILSKVSRFQQILLVHDDAQNCYEIRNDLAAPWRIHYLSATIANSSDKEHLSKILDSIFTDGMPLDMAKNIALSLFLKCSPAVEKQTPDTTYDFFQKLHCSLRIDEIQTLMKVVLFQSFMKNQEENNNATIDLLKSYINQHLDQENLSLKWLAENYLFISIGYLSKMFVKEEGVRFSEYLNQKRVEEAKRLMTVYQNDNIKHIAAKVGFGSNPQYFSQVFKRYTRLTPTEYMEKLKNQASPSCP